MKHKILFIQSGDISPETYHSVGECAPGNTVQIVSVEEAIATDFPLEDVTVAICSDAAGLAPAIALQRHLGGCNAHIFRVLLTSLGPHPAIDAAIDAQIIDALLPAAADVNMLRLTVRQGVQRAEAREKSSRLVAEYQEAAGALAQCRAAENSLEKLKQDFIMIANHELRTPATIVTASLDLLEMQRDQLDENQRKLLGNARRGVRRLNDLLQIFGGMLSAGRCRMPAEAACFEMAELLREVTGVVAEPAEKRRIHLETRCPQNIHVKGDRRAMRRTIEELLSNAIKYTPDDGQIDVNVRCAGERLQLQIRDSGIGIDAQSLERIFQPFYQAGDACHHHSSKFDYLGGGPGLGLAYCKKVVEAHDGQVWALSDGNRQGSTIVVELPLSGRTAGVPVQPMQLAISA